MKITDEMVERACRVHNVGWSLWHDPQKKTAREIMRAALTAALAAQTQEPVAWHRSPSFNHNFSYGSKRPPNDTSEPDEWKPLYASPQPAWRGMDSAPKDGKHCILAVKEGAFIYSVQGSFDGKHWNAVHANNVDPLAWMPNVRLPDSLLPYDRPTPPAGDSRE